MDEFNNNNNPFDEESFAEKEAKNEATVHTQQPETDPYNQPDPYNQSAPQQNSYTPPPQQNRYTPPPQNMQQQSVPQGYDPYKQPYDPYKQPNPYAQSYNPYANQNFPTGMATASMVLGIISLVSACTMLNFMIMPLLILPIVSIILAVMYKNKHYPVANGRATAGLVTSIIAIVVTIGVFALCIFLALNYMPQMLQIIKDTYPEMYDMYYDMYYEMYPQWFEGVTSVFRNLF